MLSGFSYQANFHRGMIAIDVRSNFNLQSVQHAIRVLDSSLCKTRVECIGAGGCITLKQTYRMNRISVGIISKIQPCHHGLFVFQILYFKSCISKQWNILVSFIRPIKGVDRSRRQCTSFAFSTLNSINICNTFSPKYKPDKPPTSLFILHSSVPTSNRSKRGSKKLTTRRMTGNHLKLYGVAYRVD